MFRSVLRTVGVYKVYERRLKAEIGRSEAPRHIGIILDGNRRWAADHGNGPSYGHLVGADIAENLLDWCREIGIECAWNDAVPPPARLMRPPQSVTSPSDAVPPEMFMTPCSLSIVVGLVSLPPLIVLPPPPLPPPPQEAAPNASAQTPAMAKTERGLNENPPSRRISEVAPGIL